MEQRLEQQMAAEQFLRTGQLSHPFGLRQAFYFYFDKLEFLSRLNRSFRSTLILVFKSLDL